MFLFGTFLDSTDSAEVSATRIMRISLLFNRLCILNNHACHKAEVDGDQVNGPKSIRETAVSGVKVDGFWVFFGCPALSNVGEKAQTDG
jgi:hypothetical protein